MFKRCVTFISILFLLSIQLASAHPGRTDANGGHTCRTNCTKWGLQYGEYHYHGGSSSSSQSSAGSSTANFDLRSDEEKIADANVWQANFYLKQGSFFNSFYYITKVYDSGYSYKVLDIKDTVAQKLLEAAYVLYTVNDLNTAFQYYTFLAESHASPYSIAQSANTNAKLVASEIYFRSVYGEAIWYFNQGNYINTVMLTSKKMSEGYTSDNATNFMNKAAAKLVELAYSSFLDQDYEYSLKCYSVLSWTQYVPEDIQKGATTNIPIVASYIK